MIPIILFVFLAQLLTCCKATEKPVDCNDIYQQSLGQSKSGMYTIYPFTDRFGIQAECDMEIYGGRWTVIQRRMDGTVNFYRPWDQYAAGFGEANGEYWLGLEFIHKISTRSPHELLVEMEDFQGNKAFARYTSFSVGAECDGYKLSVSGFINGGAGDALNFHNGMKFTTFDRDQDAINDNCARLRLGGFWYKDCHHANPNGLYRLGADGTMGPFGVEWYQWKGFNYSLKFISMKIRPLIQ